MTDGYRIARAIFLHDRNTLLFSDYYEDTVLGPYEERWTLDNLDPLSLLSAIGLAVNDYRLEPNYRKEKREKFNFPVWIESVMGGTDDGSLAQRFSVSKPLHVVSEYDKLDITIYAKVVAPQLLEIRVHAKNDTEEWDDEYTYCGGFSIEWERGD